MRLVFSLSFIVSLTIAAEIRILNGRVQADFTSIPPNRIAQIEALVKGRYSKADLFSANSVQFRAETNDGIISGSFMLDFATDTKSREVWSVLTNFNWAHGITGVVTFHQCAIAKSNTYPYVPCYHTNYPTFFLRKTIP